MEQSSQNENVTRIENEFCEFFFNRLICTNDHIYFNKFACLRMYSWPPLDYIAI